MTAHDWVPMLLGEIGNCNDMNELTLKTELVATLNKFEGVVNSCVAAIRNRANELWPYRGNTVAVDGEGLLYTAGFASKEITGIEKRTLSMLRSIWTATEPYHFIVAFDSDRRIKREKFPGYKNSRAGDPKRDEIESYKPAIIDQLRGSGVQVEVVDGYESDDVLASLAMHCQIMGDECTLATEDSDCWQALGPKTAIYSRINEEFRGAQWLMSKHRITPGQAIDWLVMVGKNDVPGVDGVGKETASKFLESYGTFHNTLLSDKLTPAKRTALEAIDYWTTRELHTLTRTLPIGRTKYSPSDQG
jgi:5'-3' exonuclease